ncbi:MAG: hypothetical protein HYU99_07695 [Deltaproteobacteria bacterium]|nr:hypothetical protein [Deltaproteobacteria bacterium]
MKPLPGPFFGASFLASFFPSFFPSFASSFPFPIPPVLKPVSHTEGGRRPVTSRKTSLQTMADEKIPFNCAAAALPFHSGSAFFINCSCLAFSPASSS